MSHPESILQRQCVKWFRLQYAGIGNLLFAIPNGGFRNQIEAKIMKGEGVVSGVSDLILLYSNGVYNSLCIEMKVPGGRQTDKQRDWQELAERHGNKYVICHSLDEFMSEVNGYMQQR